MRFLYGLVVSVAAMAMATTTVVDPTDIAIEAEVNDVDFADVIVGRGSDGLGRIEMVVDGIYQGVLVETATGGVRAFDAQGLEIAIDPNAPNDDQINNTQAKVITRKHHHHHKHHGLLHKIGGVLKKFEKKAWSFFKCAGGGIISKCGLDFATCAEHGQTPAQCTAGLACGGKQVLHCI